MIERFWRSIKHEDIYLKSYDNGVKLEEGVSSYIVRYNKFRPYASHGGVTPDETYTQKGNWSQGVIHPASLIHSRSGC